MDPGKDSGCIQLLFTQNLLDAQFQVLKPPVEGVARIVLPAVMKAFTSFLLFQAQRFSRIQAFQLYLRYIEILLICILVLFLAFFFCCCCSLKVRAVGIDSKP